MRRLEARSEDGTIAENPHTLEGISVSDVLPFEHYLVRRLDEAGWPFVSDRIIRGLCHELNGRANTLSSLFYLMDGGEPAGLETRGMVGEELERLEECVRLLRLLPEARRSGSAGPGGRELLSPAQILDSLGRLLEVQPGFERVEVDVDVSPDTPAIPMDRTLFSRGFLLLLTAAAEQALEDGGRRVSLKTVSSDGLFVVQPAREGRAGGTGLLANDMEDIVADVFRQAGGSVRLRDGGPGSQALEVRVPVLAPESA